MVCALVMKVYPGKDLESHKKKDNILIKFIVIFSHSCLFLL